MHIMEGECEKSSGFLTAEGAPDIGTKTNGVVLAEEAPENGSNVPTPESKAISEEPPGQEEPGGPQEPDSDGQQPLPTSEQPESSEEPIDSFNHPALVTSPYASMTNSPSFPSPTNSPPIPTPGISPIASLTNSPPLPTPGNSPLPTPKGSPAIPTPRSESPEERVVERSEENESAAIGVEPVREPPAASPLQSTRVTPLVSPVPSPHPRENGLSSTPTPAASPKLIPPSKEKEDSEEEDKPNLADKLPTQLQDVKVEKVRKRSLDGEASSSSESDSTKKRLRHQEPIPTLPHPPDPLIHGEDERENSIQRFIEGCAQSIEEISLASEKLQKEMSALAELAKAKEIEWNSILRLRKLKEEMFERLQRKKREVQVLEGKFSEEFSHHHPFINQVSMAGMNPMMGNPMMARIPDLSKQQRPILLKPFHPAMDHASSIREGRNGPILDVKSIIADYSGRRSRHGGEALQNRRGRRRTLAPAVDPHVGPPPPRHVSSSPSLISMANMALGTAFSVRTYDPPPPPYPPPPMPQERVGGEHGVNQAMSFKEALVQFAKLGPGAGRTGNVPYPEVTLHPVGSSGSVGQPLHPPPGGGSHPQLHANQQSLHPPHPSNQSLLHGILTKTPAPAHTKPPPTTFSPTLARLLTAPDHPRPQPAHQNSSYHRPNSVNINEILASKCIIGDYDFLTAPDHPRPQSAHQNSFHRLNSKSRTDITITPVSSSNNPPPKPKEEVVLLQDEDEEGSTGDRLVIDEGPEGSNQEEVPQCQGCRQKPAQFVCAGCGNQWYCSRECQVSAWEEHSDVCSG